MIRFGQLFDSIICMVVKNYAGYGDVMIICHYDGLEMLCEQNVKYLDGIRRSGKNCPGNFFDRPSWPCSERISACLGNARK
jgi:hypothetical protein